MFITSCKTFMTLETMAKAANGARLVGGKVRLGVLLWPSISSRCPPTSQAMTKSDDQTRPKRSASLAGGGRRFNGIRAIGLTTMIAVGPVQLPRHARWFPRASGAHYQHHASIWRNVAGCCWIFRLSGTTTYLALRPVVSGYADNQRQVGQLCALARRWTGASGTSPAFGAHQVPRIHAKCVTFPALKPNAESKRRRRSARVTFRLRGRLGSTPAA